MISKANSVLFIQVMAALAFLHAGSRVAFAEKLPTRIYTTADGLGHNNVKRIVQDSRGFLWFCTFEGLSRFDGYSFTTYGVQDGLPTQVVNDLLETSTGEYWVATEGGLCLFNPEGTPEKHRLRGAQGRLSGAMFSIFSPGEDGASNEVTTLLEDRAGTIWCGTDAGLFRLEEQGGELTFRAIDLNMPSEADGRRVTTMIEDERGTFWLGSASGVYRLEAGRVTRYYKDHGLPDNFVNSLLEDSEGRVWCTSRFAGLCLLVNNRTPNHSFPLRVYLTKDGLPTAWMNQLFQATDGTLWAGSNEGLVRILPNADGRDARFRVYAQRNGLSSKDVQALAEDRTGNLWLGMANGGAVKLARSGITSFSEADGFKIPRAIFRDQAGELYVITISDDAGYLFNRFDGERFTAIKPKLPDSIYYGWGWNQLALEDRAGEWWMATGQGLFRFPKVRSVDDLARTRPKKVYTLHDGLASNDVLRVFEDSRGDIWMATANGGGLSRWDRKTGTLHHYAEGDGLPSLASFYPISFCEDRAGQVWIGFSIGGGLARYSEGHFTRFTSADGLAEGGIFNLFVDSAGRLWAPTTRGGICRIDHPEVARPAIVAYTTSDGLSSNDVKSVTEDLYGRIYFGTGRGIDRLDVASGKIRRYTPNEGALLGDVNAALRDRDGALWFSYVTGLVRLIPEWSAQRNPPAILITGLRIAGDAQPISALGETRIAPIELGPNRNELEIDFVSPGFSPGAGLNYEYKLEGAGQDWSAPSSQRTLNLAHLAPGRYRLVVRAVDLDGATSETPAEFSFVILHPLWQRWWFLMLVAALITLGIYALYRYQLANKVKVERVRTRIATDLHDDIGANLSLIAMASEVASRRSGERDRELAEALSLISGTSRELVDSMGDIVWAVNPNRDRLVDLVKRMRRFASDVFSARGITFRFEAPSDEKAMKVGTETRREMLLIFKEAVNNIARHSDCNHADIRLSAHAGWLTLEMSDNGKSFDTAGSFDGNGLVSMRQRAERLGGSLDVKSEQGRGTTVTATAPIK